MGTRASQSELATDVGIGREQVVLVLQRLRRLGWIRAIESPPPRRRHVYVVGVRDRGREISCLSAALDEWEAECRSHPEEDPQDVLRRVFHLDAMQSIARKAEVSR